MILYSNKEIFAHSHCQSESYYYRDMWRKKNAMNNGIGIGYIIRTEHSILCDVDNENQPRYMIAKYTQPTWNKNCKPMLYATKEEAEAYMWYHNYIDNEKECGHTPHQIKPFIQQVGASDILWEIIK